MNRSSIAILSVVACMSCAHAQQSMPLCAQPLSPDCVEPKWGQIDPDTLVGGIAPPVAVRMMPAQSARPASGPKGRETVRAVVEAEKKFQRETRSLTAAIKKARFDRAGEIVAGGDAITAAAEAARKAAADRYELTLYVRAPEALSPDRATLLAAKLRALNAAVKGGAPQTGR